MEKRTLIAVVVAILVVIAGAVLLLVGSGRNPAPVSAPGTAANTAPAAPEAPKSKTWVPVTAAAMVVPDERATNVPQGVAVPSMVASASLSSDARYRSFTIEINQNAFVPSTIVLHDGDAFDLKLLAVDGNYDFVQPDMGLKVSIPKGAQRLVGGSVHTTGKFTFYCASCGGPDKGPTGYFVVVPK